LLIYKVKCFVIYEITIFNDDLIQKMPGKSVDIKGMKTVDLMPYRPRGQGAITETERSVTVSPAGKKRGGRAC
jgi:hypothetical protein